MWKRAWMVVAMTALTAGCFEIPGKHVLYLEPDGAVTWTVLEEEIRFDAESRKARLRQEEDFLDLVAAGEHPAAVALSALYPASVSSRVLREETPQTVWTEASFPGIDLVYRNLFQLMGMPAIVDLELEKDRARLVITAWPGAEDEHESGGDSDEFEDGSLDMLLALFLKCRIVLTEGKFVSAEGFEIVDDGIAVEPIDVDTAEAEENNTPVTLALTWTRGRDSTGAETCGKPAQTDSRQM
jgi:hypothetical protein